MSYGLPEVVTAQTLFDKVATHLMTQGKACATTRMDSGRQVNVCFYRKGTLACGVGCLIPNGHPALNLISRADHHLLRSVDERLVPYGSLLRALQVAHDNAADKSDFRLHCKARLVTVAKDHKLSIDVLLPYMAPAKDT